MRFITTNHFAEISMSASGGKATSHFRERRLLTGACHDVFYDRDEGAKPTFNDATVDTHLKPKARPYPRALIAACAADSRAIGTRNGEHET
ncbi:hypothetical protein PDO_3940 [Rhizobium sp. PDO1-076]|nr:hypothetical protein PDO_3940 [Rhizobium sp. PDO1-076]